MSTTKTTQELYHDGAMCPECGERVGVPCPATLAAHDEDIPPHRFCGEMECASCGHGWDEDDLHEIARAWFAHGAHEQHLREEKARE